MSPITEVGFLLINTLGSLVVTTVVLRFLLQLVRADFYNPVSQFIVRFTNPMLMPLRRVIPGFGGIDLASVVLAVALQFVIITGIMLLLKQSLPWANMAVWSFIAVVALTLKIYFWAMIIVIIASWVAPGAHNPAVMLTQQLIEPVMRPIRGLLPDLGGLDFSPIFLVLGIQIIEILLISPVAKALAMPTLFY